MDAFWIFAQSYWWLVFPLAGVIGGAVKGIGKAMERSAKRRHERRIEVIRAKGAVQAARYAGPPADALTEAASPDAAATRAATLERLFAEHDEVTARWLDYELDVAKLIAFPTMSDGRQPLTAAFLRAKKTADALRPDPDASKATEKQVAEYMDAVGEFSVAFDIAEREARRLRTSGFSVDERKRLDRAQQLLKVALDESATQAERHTAYKRVRDEIDGLIVLSDEAVVALEKKVAGELPTAES